MSNGERREDDYRLARIGAAIGLTVTLVGLLFLDALRPEYMIDKIVFGGLVTTIITLLGIEVAGQALRR